MASRFWAWNRNAHASLFLIFAQLLHLLLSSIQITLNRIRQGGEKVGGKPCTGFPLSASRGSISQGKWPQKKRLPLDKKQRQEQKQNPAIEVAKRENRSWLDYKNPSPNGCGLIGHMAGENLCVGGAWNPFRSPLCEGLTLTAEPYVYPVCAEIWLWAMDIVRAAHRFGTQGGLQKMDAKCHGWGLRGVRGLLSQLRVSCAAKFTSSRVGFFYAPPCCCSGPFLITSFAEKKKGPQGLLLLRKRG